MKTRDEHLAWCKQRALKIFASGDSGGAIASMLRDLQKSEDGAMFDAGELAMLEAEARFYTNTPQDILDWIWNLK